MRSLLVVGLYSLSLSAMAQDHPSLDWLYAQADSLAQVGAVEEAIARYDEILLRDSTEANAVWQRGNLNYKSQHFEDAYHDFRHVTKLAPGFVGAHGNLGWVLILLGHFEEAQEPTRRAIALDTTSFVWPLNLGHTYLLVGEVDIAYLYYEASVRRMRSQEDLSGAMEDFGLFEERGWEIETSQAAGAWMQVHFDEWQGVLVQWQAADSLFRVGRVQLQQSDFKEAAKSFVAAAEVERKTENPRSIPLAAMLGAAGYVYDQMGQYQDALDYYEKALEIDRRLEREADIAVDLNNIGGVYHNWGRYEDALSYFEEALEIDRHLQRETEIAVDLNNIGSVYHHWGRYEAALAHFEEALMISRRFGPAAGEATFLGNIGQVYHSWGRYEEALAHYEEALEIDRRLEREADIAVRLNNIGGVYQDWGRYEDALAHFEEVLELNRRLGLEADVAIALNNIGSVYQSRGRFKEALAYYVEALAIDRRLGRESSIAVPLGNIGNLYHRWGRYEDALSYYNEALEIDRRLGSEAEIAVHSGNIGGVYQDWGRFEEALTHYEEALEITRHLEREVDIAAILNNIGGVYQDWGRFEEALTHYEEALEVAHRLGIELPAALGNIGSVYHHWGQPEKALSYYEEALEIAHRIGREADIATTLSNIGLKYYDLGQYDHATDILAESIGLKERLRLTATGEIRRDYLHSQISTYRSLLSAHLRAGQHAETFRVAEQSRTRVLLEQLAGTDSIPALPSLQTLEQRLDEDTAIITYANADTGIPILLVLNHEGFYGMEVPDSTFMAHVRDAYGDDIMAQREEHQQASLARRQAAGLHLAATQKESAFDIVVKHYRQLLANAHELSRGVESAADSLRAAQRTDLSRRLHALLIEPLAEHLTGKKRLLIVPDAILGFLPFETLQDSTGSYLIERYDVRYIQSLTLLNHLEERSYVDIPRKPLLAFGGAVYDEDAEAGPALQIESAAQLEAVQNATYAKLDRGGDQKNSYAALGYGRWSELPGTLEEVQALGAMVAGAEVVTGLDVSEDHVKQRSASGDLAQYRVVHFATHGLVVPEVPALSALVLSQHDVEGASEEDGYLRMEEIAGLKLQADFVNLSACETGLGRLYAGEGVVGLAQAFMQAGANGLSVSLWQVADASTSIFMQQVYRLVEEEKMGYAEAITEVKRSFLRGDYGDAWRSPYFWAPFVYYGRSDAFSKN